MAFLKETEPFRGVALDVLPGVRRIVANNPSLMTYHGTNTYLIAHHDGFVVLDPGPDDGTHVQNVINAVAGRVSAIFLSHTHADHLGATSALKRLTGAPTCGYRHSADPSFEPDILLSDGQSFCDLKAIYTPGHASDHLCYAWRQGIIFSADHVMAWSSSIVSPPSGNMADYIKSLKLLLGRQEDFYLPGHGPALPSAKAYVQDALSHRLKREARIFQRLQEGEADTLTLVDGLYSKADPWLRRAAERNVLAHLIKLESENLVTSTANARGIEVWRVKKGLSSRIIRGDTLQ